jgi:DNA-binding response OmpR family regulator
MADYTSLIHRLEARADALSIEAAKAIRELAGDRKKPAVFGRLTVYPDGRGAGVDGKPLYLPRQQAIILSVLAAHPGARVPKERIYPAIWEPDEEPRKIQDSFYTQMGRLRFALWEHLGYDAIDQARYLGYALLSEPQGSSRRGKTPRQCRARGNIETPAGGFTRAA